MRPKKQHAWFADRNNVGVWQCTDNPEHMTRASVSPGVCDQCDGDMVPAPDRKANR